MHDEAGRRCVAARRLRYNMLLYNIVKYKCGHRSAPKRAPGARKRRGPEREAGRREREERERDRRKGRREVRGHGRTNARRNARTTDLRGMLGDMRRERLGEIL